MKVATWLTAILIATGSVTAAHANLLTNGDFETGDFTGWTHTNQLGSDGDWFIQPNTGAGSPANGFPTPVNGAGGQFFAITDQQAGGSHALSQAFSGVAGGIYTLSFDAFVNDGSGFGPQGTGTDFSAADLNQHVQIDLNGNLVYTGILTPDWASYSFDISSFIVTGSNLLIFTEVDNILFLNQGLDNVSVLAQVASVPEPITLSLFGAGLVGAAVMRRRKKA